MWFVRDEISKYNKPLFSVSPIIDFKFRIQLIGKQILQYKHMYPLSDEFYKATIDMLTLSSKM